MATGSNFPAFPNASVDGSGGFEGMTMREWYAGLAMQGLIMSGFSDHDVHDIARWAFRQADSMLAEAAKENP